jgi:hypothetical protein
MSEELTGIALQMRLDGVNWTDVTADVLLGGSNSRTLVTHYGNWSTAPEELLAQAGSLTWTMDNGDTNSAGLAGYYTPGHANCRNGFEIGIKVSLTFYYGGISYEKFTGTLRTVVPSPDPLEDPVTDCTATDWLDDAAQAKIRRIPAETNKRFDEGATTLMSEMTAPAATSFQVGLETFPSIFDLEQDESDTIYTLLGKLIKSEFGNGWLLGDGTLALLNRNGLLMATLSNGTLDEVMDGLQIGYGTDRREDIVDVTIWPRRVDPNLVTLATLVTGGQYLSIGPGETAQILLSYRDPNGSSRIGGTGVVAPAIGTDYKFGSVGDGTTFDLNADLTFVSSEVGGNTTLFLVRNDAGVTGYINLFKLRGYGVYPFDPVVVEDDDGLGNNTLSFDMAYLQSKNQAQSICDYLAAKVQRPGKTIERMTFLANKDADCMLAALEGEPGTRWTIRNWQTAVANDWFINGVELTIGGGLMLTAAWCALSADLNSYWILDTSALDVDTKLAV